MRRSGSILIVEDNPDMAEICQDVLGACSYEVRVATTGREALALLQAQAPDLVVMDLTLPDMGFAQLICAMRGLEHCLQTPLILVSGRPDLAAIARQYGAFAHLQKPFDIHELVKLLRP